MTVATEASSISYTEDGVSTVFAVPFKFTLAGDLIVERLLADGTAQTLAIGSDYTVAGAGADAGGSITRTAAASGATLFISRSTSRQQLMRYATGDSFPALSHEQSLDRLAMVDQEQDGALGRSFKVPVGEAAGSVPALGERIGSIPVFTADGGMTAMTAQDLAGGSVLDFGDWSEDDPLNDLGLWSGDPDVVELGLYPRHRLLLPKPSSRLLFENVVLALSEAVVDPNGNLFIGDNQTAGGMGAVLGPVFSGARSGETDIAAALLAASTAGPLTLPPGRYRIASSPTLPNRIHIPYPGITRFVISDGALPNFAGQIDAPPGQIFDLEGSGGVAGLTDAWFEWFADDASAGPTGTPTTDCRPMCNAFAAALNAVGVDYVTSGGSIGRFAAGRRYLIDGTTTTVFHNCSLYGAGSAAVMFLWSGSVTNGFTFVGNRGQIGGFQFDMAVGGTVPTAGAAILNLQRNGTFRDIIINDCFDGWMVPSASSTNSYWGCPVYGALNTGKNVNAQEQHFHDCHVVAIDDWATITGISGTFNVGDAVSIAGRNGLITAAFGGGKFKISWLGPEPVPPTTITNASVSGVGTLSSNTPAHQTAAAYWQTLTGAIDLGNVTDDGDHIGGLYGLRVQGQGNNQVSGNPNWCRTEANFCADTTYRGSVVDKAYGIDLNGWFSSSRNTDAPGLEVTNSNDIRIDARFVNNSGPGLKLWGSNYFVDVERPTMDGNCANYSSSTAIAELVLLCTPGSAIHDITIKGGKMGYPDLFGRTPVRGLYVGNSDGTTGAQASRVNLIGLNVASGKALINATQINNTDQRLRIVACTGITDQ